MDAINAWRNQFGFGNERGYMRRYNLRGLGPNEDEYWRGPFSDFGSIGAGGGRDTHVELEAEWMESLVEAGGDVDDR